MYQEELKELHKRWATRSVFKVRSQVLWWVQLVSEKKLENDVLAALSSIYREEEQSSWYLTVIPPTGLWLVLWYSHSHSWMVFPKAVAHSYRWVITQLSRSIQINESTGIVSDGSMLAIHQPESCFWKVGFGTEWR